MPLVGAARSPMTAQLAKSAGSYDVAGEVVMAPGASPMKISGVDTFRSVFGGVVMHGSTRGSAEGVPGAYEGEVFWGFDPAKNCLPDAMHPLFINGAKLDGHITLEDADAVDIGTLSQSLCVLLSGDSSTYGDGGSPIERCKRTNGVIDFKGDWCSTTNMPADAACFDAVSLGADFAASAITIN